MTYLSELPDTPEVEAVRRRVTDAVSGATFSSHYSLAEHVHFVMDLLRPALRRRGLLEDRACECGGSDRWGHEDDCQGTWPFTGDRHCGTLPTQTCRDTSTSKGARCRAKSQH